MATTLPASTNYTGASVTQGGKKTFVDALRSFIADLFGTDSTMATAHAAFKNYDASTLHNLGLDATVGSNALTIALKTAAGNDPSAADPVMFGFRSATLTSGNASLVAVTAAQSIVVPSTATLGMSNGVAARLWVAELNNAGSGELAVCNTQLSDGLMPVNEGGVISTTALSTGSDSAGVWYSTTSRSNVPFRLVGYIELTEATAGTYATAPTLKQPMGPGVRRPGEVVQTRTVLVAGPDSESGTSLADAAGMTASITPTSAINRVMVRAMWMAEIAALVGVNPEHRSMLVRNSTSLSSQEWRIGSASGGGGQGCVAGHGVAILDAPASTSAVTYKLQHRTTNASSAANTYNFSETLEEIMA